MTPAEELWYAVVHHCHPSDCYRIAVAGSRLTLSSNRNVYVEPDATGSWIVVDGHGHETVAVRNEADSAVWFAVERICQ